MKEERFYRGLGSGSERRRNLKGKKQTGSDDFTGRTFRAKIEKGQRRGQP